MKKSRTGIMAICVFIMVAFAGSVYAVYIAQAEKNSWDPRVYDPLTGGPYDITTTKTGRFYNISFSMSAIDPVAITKIQFAGYPADNQDPTNPAAYINGTLLLEPFNLQGGDHIQANLLVPVEDTQQNTTYGILVYSDYAMFYQDWSPNST